jgi:hypothetical protein
MPESARPPNRSDGAPSSMGFLGALAAVFASFLGIRKRAAGEHDMARIKPAHVIVAALLCVAIFVAVLVALVTFIARRG